MDALGPRPVLSLRNHPELRFGWRFLRLSYEHRSHANVPPLRSAHGADAGHSGRRSRLVPPMGVLLPALRTRGRSVHGSHCHRGSSAVHRARD
jgi:hypothetical protein